MTRLTHTPVPISTLSITVIDFAPSTALAQEAQGGRRTPIILHYNFTPGS